MQPTTVQIQVQEVGLVAVADQVVLRLVRMGMVQMAA